MGMTNPLACDLDHVLSHTETWWEALREQRIFITGGTGFFGCWLLESFAWANDVLHLNAHAVVLTRDVEGVRKKLPHLADHPAIHFHAGDVRSFPWPAGAFSHIIHAGAVRTMDLQGEAALEMFETMVEGTRRTLELARRCGAKKLLFVSSGAIYGTPPPAMTHIPEEFREASDTVQSTSAYAEGKRAAELLCVLYAQAYGIDTTMARCFAFLGPYQPLDRRLASGDFIRDGLVGGPIQVHGDGTPSRSYLYAADLAIWLWTILFRGRSCRAYNVGSEHEVTIADLARVVARSFEPPREVRIAKTPRPSHVPERYVPLTHRAQAELGLRQTISLPEAVVKTIRWHQEVTVGQNVEVI